MEHLGRNNYNSHSQFAYIANYNNKFSSQLIYKDLLCCDTMPETWNIKTVHGSYDSLYMWGAQGNKFQ